MFLHRLELHDVHLPDLAGALPAVLPGAVVPLLGLEAPLSDAAAAAVGAVWVLPRAGAAGAELVLPELAPGTYPLSAGLRSNLRRLNSAGASLEVLGRAARGAVTLFDTAADPADARSVVGVVSGAWEGTHARIEAARSCCGVPMDAANRRAEHKGACTTN